MSSGSVERRTRDPVSCRKSIYITYRPPMHSVAALLHVGRRGAIAPNPTRTLLLTPPVYLVPGTWCSLMSVKCDWCDV